MADTIAVPITFDKPAIHVDVATGQTISLHGFCTSKTDGSILDAATTTWPKEAVQGASVDPIGLIEVESGGFHMTKRDPTAHEVELIATNGGADACAAAGVAAPCLVINKRVALQKRLMGWDEFQKSMSCNDFTAVVPVKAPPPFVPDESKPYLQAGAGIAIAAVVGFVAWTWKRRRDASPVGKMLALARNVKEKLEKADQVLAAPLAPAVETAIKALREKRVDPTSAEGKRVAEALRRVNERLEASMREAQAAKEQEAADELVQEMESALEAAEEVKRAHAP